VAIALGASGAANRLSVSASDVVPGDTINRALDLSSTSTSAMKTVKLITTATTSSVLDTNTTDGLQMYIRSCSLSAAGPRRQQPRLHLHLPVGDDLRCAGLGGLSREHHHDDVGGVTLNNLTAITTAGPVTDHLVITVILPQANTSANLATPPSSTIQYSFTGTQRDGTNR